MVKIKLEMEDPKYFHPKPSPKMTEMLKAIQEVLKWEYPKPIREITRAEAKDIIDRGMKSAKRRKIHLRNEYNNKENPVIKKVNEELQLV